MKTAIYRIAALALLVMLATPVLGQQNGQKHEHEAMHSNDDLNLQRPDEGKWASDASLRQGMSELKKAFEPAYGAYRNGEFDAEQASGLADAIEEEINFMIANCRIPADADAELHKLLAAALGAAKSLRESEHLHEGLHQLHRVLQAYPDYFQHPDWSES